MSFPAFHPAEVRRAYRTGLIGAGIQKSGSPAIHMDEARALGLEYRYQLLDTDCHPQGPAALAHLLGAAQLEGFAGLNITYPCKQAVIPLLDELSPDAQALQSVNTVVFDGARRIGHNTDWWGFAENFRRGLPDVARERVVLVGAGGAGSAVGYAALQLGTRHLVVNDIDAVRAAELAQRLQALFPDRRVEATTDVAAALASADGFIHASPTGMAKHPGLPVAAAALRPALWVAEVVYVPLDTELLKVARSLGCRTLDGGGMAVFQAARAFELFTGVAPDHERMLARFNATLRVAAGV